MIHQELIARNSHSIAEENNYGYFIIIQVTGDNIADDYFIVNENGEVSIKQSLIVDQQRRTTYNVSMVIHRM